MTRSLMALYVSEAQTTPESAGRWYNDRQMGDDILIRAKKIQFFTFSCAAMESNELFWMTRQGA